MTRGCAALLLALVLACTSERGLAASPSQARANEWIFLRGPELGRHGAAVVTFAGVAAQPVVIESDELLRTRMPELSRERSGTAIDVTISFADGSELTQPEALRYVAGPIGSPR